MRRFSFELGVGVLLELRESLAATDVDFHSNSFDFPEVHCHDYWEFTLVTEGALNNIINGKKIPLKANTLSLIRPNDSHCLKSPSPNNSLSYSTIVIRDRLMRGQCDLINAAFYEKLLSGNEIVMDVSEDFTAKIENCLHRIRLLSADQIETQELYKKTMFVLLMSVLFEHINTKSNKPEHPAWFSHILHNIESAPNLNLSTKDLCEITSYSRAHLNRLFKQYLNQSPGEFLLKIKMNYSSRLLLSTNRTIMNIAQDVGYGSLCHFNSAFKTHFGVTPGNFRKKRSNL